MTTVDCAKKALTMKDLFQRAVKGPVRIKGPKGKEFILAEIDDSELEAETLRNSTSFMKFLEKRSKKKGGISLAEARKRLLN